MSPGRSARRRSPDASLHPLHLAERRIAQVRAQSLMALLALAAAPMLASAVALVSIFARGH